MPRDPPWSPSRRNPSCWHPFARGGWSTTPRTATVESPSEPGKVTTAPGIGNSGSGPSVAFHGRIDRAIGVAEPFSQVRRLTSLPLGRDVDKQVLAAAPMLTGMEADLGERRCRPRRVARYQVDSKELLPGYLGSI